MKKALMVLLLIVGTVTTAKAQSGHACKPGDSAADSMYTYACVDGHLEAVDSSNNSNWRTVGASIGDTDRTVKMTCTGGVCGYDTGGTVYKTVEPHHWYETLQLFKTEMLEAYVVSLAFLVLMYLIGTQSIKIANDHKVSLLNLQFQHEELKVREREVALDEEEHSDPKNEEATTKRWDDDKGVD